MSADAQPDPKQRSTNEKHLKPPYPNEVELKSVRKIGSSPATENGSENDGRHQVGTLCVVCGDRACSHLYYGVAACHGCKCFFWRTVKSNLSYKCRYNGNCSISTAGRNACRFCRFTRCLDSGMKLEAVRLDKKEDNKKTKRKKMEVDSDETHDDVSEVSMEPDAKRLRMDNRLLASSLLLIDRTTRDGTCGKSPYYPVNIEQAMMRPELLNSDRTPMSYYLGSQSDMVACGESERRLVVWAFDWTRQAADIQEENTINIMDKICLLRSACAPLIILELAVNCCNSAETILPLPTNTYLHKDINLPNNCFLNKRLLDSVLQWASKQLKPMKLTQKELVLLKALIVLNPDAFDLTHEGETAVSELRSRIQSSLFQFCADVVGIDQGARRICSILLLVPQIQVMAVELLEHIRMRNTFSPTLTNPLLYELYGDIFECNQQKDDHMVDSASCSPDSSSMDSS